MKNIIIILSLLLSNAAWAQTYNTHFQFESAYVFGAPNYSKIQLANGNTALSVGLSDSTRITNPLDNFYNAPSSPTRGSGIVVLSPTNQIVWHKAWHPISNTASERVTVYNVMEDAWGNIYVTGDFQGDFDINCDAGVQMVTTFAPNHHNGFVVKLDAQGNFIWGKTIQSATAAFGYMNLYDGYIANNGNVVVSGVFRGVMDFDPNAGIQTQQSSIGTTHYSVYLLTLDSAGNYQDVKTLNRGGGASNILGNISDMHHDAQGNLYVAYNYKDSLDVDFTSGTKHYYNPIKHGQCLVKYDSAFNIIWDKQMPDNYKRLKFSFNNNGEFYLFTQFDSTTVLNDNTPAASNGSEDIVYEKWNAAGNCLWSKTMGGSEQDYLSSLEEFNSELYLLYSFADSLNTNTGSNDAQLFAPDRDIALSRLSLSGQHLTTSVIVSDSTLFLRYHDLLLDASTIRIYFRNMGTTDVDPSPTSTVNMTQQWSNNVSYACVVWNNGPTSVKNIEDEKTILVYPNPTTGQFTVELDGSYMMALYSLEGKLVHQQQGKNGLNKISAEAIPNGLYLLHCADKEGVQHSVKISIVR